MFWNCTVIGDVNRDGRPDAHCTVLRSKMVETKEGRVDYVYEDSKFVLDYRKNGIFQDVPKSEPSSGKPDMFVSTYMYDKYFPFCNEYADKCFSVNNQVLTKTGYSKTIKAFELRYSFDAASKKFNYDFDVLLKGGTLVDIETLKTAPEMAKKYPLVWNALVFLFADFNPRAIFLGA